MVDDATARQIAAADPKVSTWLSANAGSGKTRVLTDRVARLLLGKVSPQNILCLTYTKAAASEMQNRLFARLGKWAMMGDTDLAKELDTLGAPPLENVADMAFARTLFARAIDTPGGLRIQTIHSFCASLLRRFPLESGVSPLFREMEDRAARLLRQDVVDAMARGDNSDLIADLADHYSGEDFGNLAAEATRHRAAGVYLSDAEIWQQFQLPHGLDERQILDSTFSGSEAKLFSALQPVLSDSDKITDRKAADIFAGLNFSDPSIADLVKLFSALLYGAKTKNPFNAKLDAFPTKALRQNNPQLMADLAEFMIRVEQARQHYIHLLAAQKTRAFRRFAAEFLPIYNAQKADRGWLDFDDLITRARSLLSDPAVAQWVLFRLDGGLDHILVDEAQDTSPDQWKVIELLAQEFSAGIGARAGIERTIFVVGDLKQSIYSFQGADPQAFEQMRQHFSRDLAASHQKLFERSLEHSFRSSTAILTVVDAVFDNTGVSGIGGPARHLAFYGDMPGRVDLWGIVEKPEAEPEKEWCDPADRIARNDHRAMLADSIAAHIRDLEKTGSIAGENGNIRPIEFGDFLILVQSRSPLFHQIIRACKALELPIAGADRLKIGAEIAVKDLQALLAFLALPQDSLSLAAALRSPLFGLSEAALFDLAHSRQNPGLWSELIRRQDDFQPIVDMLTDLRNQVDFLRPFELLERILTRHFGRTNLLARLGPEAEDGIDALLDQALAYERIQTPSLTGFLSWLEADGVEIKRQSDASAGLIRVMTTHGAKGLESPIVILPDTADRGAPPQNEIIVPAGGALMWKTGADLRPPIMAAAIAQSQQAREEEATRLLYVALTRAEKWLIVCASGDVKPEGDSWYRRVETGMKAAGATQHTSPTGQGLRLEYGDWPDVRSTSADVQSAPSTELPGWATRRAAARTSNPGPVSPSDFPGEKSLPAEFQCRTAQDAAAHGRHIHALLEHLPDQPIADWPNIAQRVLSDAHGNMPANALIDVMDEAASVINNPDLADLFGPNSLAEVAVSASFPGCEDQRIHGTIDRLVVSPTRVLIVDFKSNRVIPANAKAIPVGILRQMAAYLAAVEQIYPGRDISTAIVWTHSATLMLIPHDIVRSSVRGLPTS